MFNSNKEELAFYRKVIKHLNASIYIEDVDPYKVTWVADNEYVKRILGFSASEITKNGEFASALIENSQDFYEAITLSTESLKSNPDKPWVGVCRMKNKTGPSNWVLFSTSSFEISEQGESTKSVTIAMSLIDLFKSKETLIDCITDLKKQVYHEELFSLTKRQIQIIELTAEGKSSTQMAQHLKISKYTVDDHKKAVYKKLACKNQNQLLIKAAKYGIV